MNELIKLIKEYKTTKNKKAYFLVILEMSGEIQFPIYSLIQLINSSSRETTRIISSEGWIEKDIDLKLNELQKERNNIEKERTDLKKAKLELERVLREKEVNAKQIKTIKGHDNSNTAITENTNISKQNSNSKFSSNQPQKLPNAKETFILGIISFVSMFIFPFVFGTNYFSLLSIILSIVTVIISTKGKKLYQNNITSGKYSVSSFSQLKTGRVFAFIPLGLFLLTIIIMLIAGIINFLK